MPACSSLASKSGWLSDSSDSSSLIGVILWRDLAPAARRETPLVALMVDVNQLGDCAVSDDSKTHVPACEAASSLSSMSLLCMRKQHMSS
jgi:hypothetical protein